MGGPCPVKSSSSCPMGVKARAFKTNTTPAISTYTGIEWPDNRG